MNRPFPREALGAAAYRFEQSNGNRIQLSEFDEIMHHRLTKADPDELAEAIRDTITSGSADAAYRQSGYFALGKKCDDDLMPFFRERLQIELEAREAEACFQLMVALDNLDEDVFDPKRDEPSAAERDPNERDARAYLNNLS